MAFDRQTLAQRVAELASKGVYLGSSSWKYQLCSVALLAALFGLLTVVSTFAAADAYESYRHQFVGTWKTQRDQRVTTVTWRADGTWESETVDGGKVLFKMSGVWWTHEAQLHGVCLTTSDPAIPRGEDEASPVLEVGKDHYVIRNWRGIEKKYTRVKANG